VHHVVRLFYEAANRAAALGFLGKERNTNPAVSKAPQTRNNDRQYMDFYIARDFNRDLAIPFAARGRELKSMRLKANLPKNRRRL